MSRNRVTLVGEVKWTGKPLDGSTLRALAEYKVPALEQAGFKTAKAVRTVLYSKSGYTDGLRRRAADDPMLHLVDVPAAMATGR